MFTYSEELFSDFHKDTYGFRPRAHEFYDATPARKQEIWDAMGEDFNLEQERERLQKIESVAAFNRDIEMYMASIFISLGFCITIVLLDYHVLAGIFYSIHVVVFRYKIFFMCDNRKSNRIAFRTSNKN